MPARLFLIRLLFVALTLTASAAPAALFDSAVTLADVDPAASQSFVGDTAKPATPDQLRWVLGLGGERRPWSAAQAKEGGKEAVHFRIAFVKPVPVGTLLGGVGEVRVLRADAPFPGDPNNAAHWLKSDTAAAQNHPPVLTFPPGTATRALLCTVAEPRGRVDLHLLRPLAARLHNVTPGATANADGEAAPASLVTRPNGGRGWESSGKDQKGINSRPPISELQPSWFVLSWDAPRRLAGLVLADNFEKFALYTFNGPAGVNPAVGTPEEWKLVKTFSSTRLGETRAITFPAPLETRGLKIEITKTSFQSPQVAKLDALNAVLELGDAPAPAATLAANDKPPFALPYTLPQAGKLTLAVNDASGRRVRNVMANDERPAGAGEERWDLKDEAGKFVSPGRYEMKAITHPGLELRYEMTAYPNVGSLFPDRTPWMNSVSGPGGWLADHSPPRSACVAGDKVYLGAPVAESGVSLIECDTSGKRLWAHHSFEAFTGAWWLASDGKTVFAVAPANNFAASRGLDRRTEAIWGVDIATKAVRTVAMLPPSNTRNRGIQGVAARDGKVFLAIRSADDWLLNAAAPADVDVQNCLPFYPVKRKERAAYEIVPDPRGDFLRLFRVTGTPPGYGATGLTYLETSQGGGRQQHIVLAFNQPVALGSVVFPYPKGQQVKLSVHKPGAPYPPKADDASQWLPFTQPDTNAWAVWPAPENTRTRALRVTFMRGADDLLADIEDPAKTAATLDLDDKSGKAKPAGDVWSGRLEGMKLLARRFSSLVPGATVRVSSGQLDKDGGWDAQRTAPVSESDPGVYLMEWSTPQLARGLAVRQMHAKRAVVEAFTGTGTPSLNASAGWEKVGEFTQARHYHHSGFPAYNGTARYFDSYVDFGREVSTRALRLRVVEQFLVRDEYGFRDDHGAAVIEPSRCRLYGVAPLRHLGGSAGVDPLMNERLEVVDAATGKVERELPLAGVGEYGHEWSPGNLLAFNAAGELFAAAGKSIVKVNLGAAAAPGREGKKEAGMRGGRNVAAGLPDAFSLTPALSRWEREHVTTVRDASAISGFDTATGPAERCDSRETRGAFLPLPAGEGRGEGERVALATAPASFQPAAAQVNAIAPQHKVFTADLIRPTALAFDRAGNLFVFDSAPERRNVRVYAPDGKFLRSIGTPGGYREGAWDPNRFNDVTALAVDSADHLWAVDWTYHPKRISQWTTDGKFLQEFLGPTAYGGAGALDPWDKRRLFYGPMEFDLDWQTGKTRLKNLTWLGATRAGDIPIRVQGRDYLVTSFQVHGPEQPYGAVYLHTGDRLKLVAAVGQANAFEPLRDGRMLAELGTPVLANFKFIFTDRNGDGVVQAGEIQLTPKPADMNGLTPFQRDLSIQASRTRWVVKEFLPSGVPVYSEERIEALEGRQFVRLDNGNFQRMGDGKLGEAVLTPTGEQLWTYASEGAGVQQTIKPWRPDQVVSQFSWVGHETAHAGDLGEFTVIHANMGAWNIWTSDGLFAGQIFRDLREPRAQAWSMASRERGLRLEQVTAGQEHFWGWFCRSVADNKYYLVAGHNHASVVEVAGLEKFKRINRTFDVTAADVARAQEWERVHERREAYARAAVVDCFRVDKAPKIDGSPGDWPVVSATVEGDVSFRVAWDDTRLYLCYEANARGPFKNTGTQWDRLFKTGASVDLQLGTDPAAPADRKAPVAGDLRLLLTLAGGEPAAVLYQPVFPGARESEAWKVVSPVAELTFDRVTKVAGAQVALGDTDRGWCVEAAVPLAALGLKPAAGARLKMDWGILTTGRDGNEVLRRLYWSNKATTVTADAPSEARLHPDLWGHLRFHAETATAHLDPTAKLKKDKSVEDLLNDLK